ncbi:MAG: hypothetical protein AAFV25_10640, partial [Bacteroidota bacterium]
MIKYLLPVFLFSMLSLQSQNLVPNHSFEDVFNLPIYPNPKNSYEFEPKSGYKPFQKNTKYWFAGSKTTPDLRITSRLNYQACQRVYREHCDKAHTGEMMVGIITWLKNTYTDSYREYVQVKLIQPLQPGEETFFELWVAKERTAKLTSNNLGLLFAYNEMEEDTEEVVSRSPQFNVDTLINKDKQRWVKLEGSFVPDKPYRYLIIGNFFDNENTQTDWYKDYAGSPYTPPYAYYLLDDIKVWQPNVPLRNPNFAGKKVGKDSLVRLSNIFFETDQSILRDSSIAELTRLHQLLSDYPKMRIAIHGHTDN